MPLILAEQDRDAYRRQQAAIAREREIMKDVEGWEVSLVPLVLALDEGEGLRLRTSGRRGSAGVVIWAIRTLMQVYRSERAHTTPRDIRQTPSSSSKSTRPPRSPYHLLPHHPSYTIHYQDQYERQMGTFRKAQRCIETSSQRDPCRMMFGTTSSVAARQPVAALAMTGEGERGLPADPRFPALRVILAHFDFRDFRLTSFYISLSFRQTSVCVKCAMVR